MHSVYFKVPRIMDSISSLLYQFVSFSLLPPSVHLDHKILLFKVLKIFRIQPAVYAERYRRRPQFYLYQSTQYWMMIPDFYNRLTSLNSQI